MKEHRFGPHRSDSPGRQWDESAHGAVRDLLKDNAYHHREAAIDLSRAANRRTVDTLCVAVADKNLERAKRQPSRRHHRRQGGILADRQGSSVANERRLETDGSVRNHLIRLAGILGKTNDEAVGVLTSAAQTDDSTENRIAAIQELAELGARAKSAVPTLKMIAAQDGRAAILDAAEKAVKKIES